MNGPHKGERRTISRDEPTTIGKDASCAIQVSDDPEVADEHCAIAHTDHDELTIQDCGSMNKVLINSHETSNAKLKHGDMIEIGRTRFLVQAFVQADVKGAGTESIPNRNRLIIRITLAALLAAAVAVGFNAIRTAQKSSDRELAKDELIPPSIFKDIKATAPEPKAPPDAKPTPTPAPERVAAPVPVDPPKEKITHPVKPTEPTKEVPPPIVIVSLAQQKFPQKPEYDEMRVASLRLRTTGSVVEDAKVAIRFEFFDRDLTTGEITPARAIVPTKALSTHSLSSTGEETVTAAYTVPKGLRTARAARSGRTFYGLRVKVMYAGELVAQKAIPKTLLDKE